MRTSVDAMHTTFANKFPFFRSGYFNEAERMFDDYQDKNSCPYF